MGTSKLNSRQKGKRGERELALFLREHGFGDARRGVQYQGGPGSADVVGLPGWHIECKLTEKLNLRDATAQAEGDCGGKPWVVAHRRNHGQWLAIVKLEELLKLLHGT